MQKKEGSDSSISILRAIRLYERLLFVGRIEENGAAHHRLRVLRSRYRSNVRHFPRATVLPKWIIICLPLALCLHIKLKSVPNLWRPRCNSLFRQELFIIMEFKKLYPEFCKHTNCFKQPDYEFTDYRDGKTVVLGHSCSDHFVENHKLFEEIFNKKKERGKDGKGR